MAMRPSRAERHRHTERSIRNVFTGGARSIFSEQPGRLVGSEPEPKPSKADTPYRSRFYVPARHSADGNAYQIGEPIPEAEHVRQLGIEGMEDPHAAIDRGPSWVTCTKCMGSGRRLPGHRGTHAPGCPGCKPCNRCEGRGRVAE